MFLDIEILATVVLILFALSASVLLVPFDLVVAASKTENSTTSSVVVRWMGVRVWRRSLSGRGGKQELEGRPGRADLFARAPLLLSMLLDAGPSLVGIFKGFRRAVRLRRLSIDVSFGVGDPAETAVLAGYLWSVAWAFDLLPRASLSLRPDMERARLDGSVSAELGVRLLPIVGALLIAYTKKPFRRLLREVRR